MKMQTPKGMRDLLPEDMIIRNYVNNIIESTFKSYGYLPLETPAMEYLTTLRAKAGAEVDKQIFVIEGNELGLRFDLTVPFARVVATNTFPKPFKAYCIGSVWRKEEPQRGRYREFWQAEIDVFGSRSMRSDAEIISVTIEVIKKLGFEKQTVVLNNRTILDALAEELGFADKKAEVFRLLDKLDKLGENEVKKQIKGVIGEKPVKELFELLKTKGTNEEKLKSVEQLAPDAVKELRQIIQFCNFPVEVDFALVRGLGYYTGPVFEVKLSDNLGSVAGGGRYDNLLSLYGQGDYATGIGIGIERLIVLIKELKKANPEKTYTNVLVATVKPEFYNNTLEFAAKLREEGINVEVDLNERNLRKQFDYANALSIPYVVVLGEKEIKEKLYTLKNMQTGKEDKLTFQDVIKVLVVR
ncbi:histidine--tRNA ligase [Candidatus Micrarchaeota archaeon]|nr:histidine--tRNA ligase [Candidatus Micrarchaeota archaeon]